MSKIFLILTMAAFLISCTTAKVTDNDIQARAETLDFGDSSSATLAS